MHILFKYNNQIFFEKTDDKTVLNHLKTSSLRLSLTNKTKKYFRHDNHMFLLTWNL